jgi:ribonuclease HI
MEHQKEIPERQAGGAIRDNGGKIICLYASSIGNTTNNAAEFGALEQGLEILIREGHVNVTVEGDSTLVISTAKILQCGTNIGKLIKHWRLAQILQRIQKHLQTLFTVDFRWVRRLTNTLADRLANEGVNHEGNMLDEAWTQFQLDNLEQTVNTWQHKIIVAATGKTVTSRKMSATQVWSGTQRNYVKQTTWHSDLMRRFDRKGMARQVAVQSKESLKRVVWEDSYV